MTIICSSQGRLQFEPPAAFFRFEHGAQLDFGLELGLEFECELELEHELH
jgi:hypothetical protein